MTTPEITPDLLLKYDRPGPRYTSYPTVPEWRNTFNDEAYKKALVQASQHHDSPLSLYVHIPFCAQRCAYCGCNTITAPIEAQVNRYLDDVEQEIASVSARLGKRKTVSQCHWGGGTPTFLDEPRMRRLFAMLSRYFDFADNAEIALETNPVTVTTKQLKVLRELGFNRISFGVQDLNPEVQHVVGRYQTAAQTESLVNLCRNLGFTGINVDLIYGLPLQTMDRWQETISSIIHIAPDRIAMYSYAHLPARFDHQKVLDLFKRPDTREKYALFADARKRLLAAGYRPIGMDHFALPGDELSLALDNHSLNRNFMGYTVRQAPDQIGFGVSAISEVADCYSQNTKELEVYHEQLQQGLFPVERGISLSKDDQIRRWVIRRLMCSFKLDLDALRRLFDIDGAVYFTAEREALAAYEEEGMIQLQDACWQVTATGAPFIRNLCMVFDAYLKTDAKTLFSRTI